MLTTPLGPLIIKWNDLNELTLINFLDQVPSLQIGLDYSISKQINKPDPIWLKPLEEYLTGYFQGKFVQLQVQIPIKSKVTKFQGQVHLAIQQIPLGQTKTYKEIGDSIGEGLSYRAVGTACGINQFLILIPCHRVVGSAKKNKYYYTAGSERKRWLLEHEERMVKKLVEKNT